MSTAQALEPEPRSVVLARRTRGLIAEMQIEQRGLAEALGMSQPNLSRKVNGRTPFSPDEIEVLAPLLGTTEPYLYGFTNDRSRPQEEAASESVRHQGLEPRTRWLTRQTAHGAVLSPLATVLQFPLDRVARRAS